MATSITTADTFESDVLASEVPVLLDVFTPHCGPCRALSPVLDKIADEYDGRARIVKLDGSKDADLAVSYKVSSVPALIAFKGGIEVGRKFGFQPEVRLREWLDELIG